MALATGITTIAFPLTKRFAAHKFATMVFVIDFETNWDFATLDYCDLWTLGGGALNLFYNGFRAVLLWVKSNFSVEYISIANRLGVNKIFENPEIA